MAYLTRQWVTQQPELQIKTPPTSLDLCFHINEPSNESGKNFITFLVSNCCYNKLSHLVTSNSTHLLALFWSSNFDKDLSTLNSMCWEHYASSKGYTGKPILIPF